MDLQKHKLTDIKQTGHVEFSVFEIHSFFFILLTSILKRNRNDNDSLHSVIF